MKIILLIVVALFLVSCGIMSPQQQAQAMETLNDMLAKGTITKAQYDALVEVLMSAGQAQWWQQLALTAGGAALSYLGVQWRRGPVATPEERVARITKSKQ